MLLVTTHKDHTFAHANLDILEMDAIVQVQSIISIASRFFSTIIYNVLFVFVAIVDFWYHGKPRFNFCYVGKGSHPTLTFEVLGFVKFHKTNALNSKMKMERKIQCIYSMYSNKILQSVTSFVLTAHLNIVNSCVTKKILKCN